MPVTITGRPFVSAIAVWWKDSLAHAGLTKTSANFLRALWEFARESTPQKRKQRFGDIDFDWERRVDTTSANTGWRERLLGALHSPYQPTEPALFHEMMGQLSIDFPRFTFIDIGSGKGRALLMASEYPFRRIIGIELLSELHRIAEANIAKDGGPSRLCLDVSSVCYNATNFQFPAEPLLIYLFNPLPEHALQQFLNNLRRSFEDAPREIVILYHNPVLEEAVAAQTWLRRLTGTRQYSLFSTKQVDEPASVPARG